MKRLPILVSLAAALGVIVPTLSGGVAQAQTEPMGRITGELVAGTEGATLGDDLTVDFIVLVGSEVGGATEATVEGDTFVLEVPLGAERRYVPRAVYQGIQYFGQPVVVTEEQPEVVAEIPPLYETTSETPDLTIGETVVTAVALDRGTGELGFVREDFILNPADLVYIGGPNGVTLRLPTPENTVDAIGENADGDFALEEGVLTTTVPIRAEGGTSIVSRYLVTYDMAEDEYVLRVTTPIAAERLVVRVPEQYVRDLEVVGEGVEGEPDSFEVAEGDPVPLRTIVLEDAGPGDSLVVRLEGLALQRNSNPLTETPGSIIAGVIAILVLGLAGAVTVARSRETPA